MAAWVTLQAFRTFVGNTNATDDALLQSAIDGGCAKVDELCGPTMATSVSERVPAGAYELPLSFWAVALTSVARWPSGQALSTSKFAVEDRVIFRTDGEWIDDDLTVTYSTGAASPPQWAVDSACLIGKHWWASRLRPSINDPSPVGFLVPKQAWELMADHLLGRF